MPGFEEYKLFFEYINKLIDRRQTVTTIYLAVNTALIGAVTYIFSNLQIQEVGKELSALGLLLAGLLACDFWRRLIMQYSALLEWWYEQIRTMEEQIPGSKKLIQKEYTHLYSSNAKDKKFGISRYEVRLAWLFSAIYIFSGFAILIMLVIQLV